MRKTKSIASTLSSGKATSEASLSAHRLENMAAHTGLALRKVVTDTRTGCCFSPSNRVTSAELHNSVIGWRGEEEEDEDHGGGVEDEARDNGGGDLRRTIDFASAILVEI